jgi:hypothetical protein
MWSEEARCAGERWRRAYIYGHRRGFAGDIRLPTPCIQLHTDLHSSQPISKYNLKHHPSFLQGKTQPPAAYDRQFADQQNRAILARLGQGSPHIEKAFKVRTARPPTTEHIKLNMSSYGSNHSGYIHPSQYAPNSQQQHQQQQQQAPQPPYPTTPGPPPTSQPQAYFPPTPQYQPTYSTSPASPWQQPTYSTSPYQQQPQAYSNYSSSPTTTPMPQPQRRSSSSPTQAHFPQSQPIAIPTRYSQPGPPVYARSHGSHHNHHVHDHHTYGDGEDVHDNGQVYGVLDEDTLRQYEKRYAKDRELEKRPTLGDSVMSMFKVLGSKRE